MDIELTINLKLISLFLCLVTCMHLQLTFAPPAHAENTALLNSIEEAKLVLEKVEKDIDENMKLMASTCMYAGSALKELSILQAEFMENQIEDFSTGIPDALELEILEEEIDQIKKRYKRAHCSEPIIIREQLTLAHKDVALKKASPYTLPTINS